MNSRYVLFSIVLVLIFGQVNAQKLARSEGAATVSGWKFIDINTVNSTISYDGVFADYRRTGSSGLFWPKGTSKSSVFTSGFWMIGKHRPTGQLRTAVMDYSSEYQPGKLLTTFNTTTNSPAAADDPKKEMYKLYKVTRGIPDSDYMNWPVQLGAPYRDLNKNGSYDQGVDNPIVWGHQQLWTVSNDADTAKHSMTGMTKPMGVELQSTFFGYSIGGPLNNTVYLRYKVINKSDADYDSVFISYWSDTDLGDANDDFAAVDSAHNLAYIYNGDNNDLGASGYGATPPAGGFVLLQGPKVFSGNSTDTALFEGKKFPGYKNLNLFSHSVYIGGGIWSDPPLGSVLFAQQAYNYQRGLIGPTGQPFINPTTNTPSRYVFSGDPVTQSGWTSTVHGLGPADVRSMLSAGPFTFAKGDTQEIVVAYVIAGGTDRLNSIVNLRQTVDEIRGHFRENFVSIDTHSAVARLYYEPFPLTKAFGRVNLGEKSDTVYFSFTNVSNDTVQLTLGSFTNSSFVRTAPASGTVKIAGGTTLKIAVVYQPTGVANMSDSLVITTSDSFSPRLVISVSGSGANVTPVQTGMLYASNENSLYTITSTTAFPTFVTNFESPGIARMAVRPGTKELYYVSLSGLYRISSTVPSFIQTSTPVGRNITSGISFLNDTTIVCAAESLLIRFNIKTGSIDTIQKFSSAFRLRALTYHPGSDQVYYSLATTFLNNPDTADAVYKIHVGTKTVTRVGRIKIGNRIRALLSDVNGKLYGLVDSTAAFNPTTYLVSINTATGAGTMIGSTGISTMVALAMDPSSPASVRPVNAQIPRKFSLEQNYPNPFNPSTTIRYSVPTQSPVTLSIFNILGKKVTELVNEHHAPGNYSAEWNGRDRAGRQVSSGVYYYTIEAGEFRVTKKMLLLK